MSFLSTPVRKRSTCRKCETFAYEATVIVLRFDSNIFPATEAL